MSCGVTTAASAQSETSANQQPAAASPLEEKMRQRERELAAARDQQRRADELQQKLKAEIAAIGQDRSKLNQELIDVAARVRTVETRIIDAEARLRPLDAREASVRDSFHARRAEITEVLAALQRAGRRAPPALLVTPEDALNSLRTAMLLGSVVPEMRARTAKLVDDLAELVALRKSINLERASLTTDRSKLDDEQARLAGLITERQNQQTAVQANLQAEATRAVTLSRQVDDLQGLIRKMEQEIASAARAAAEAEAAAAAEAALTAAQAAQAAKAAEAARKNPARMKPAVAFASTKGTLRFPVNGTTLTSFGSSDGVGGAFKGISLASFPGAQVTSPCDGWVVYAGPFRTYGQLLILNAGGGYHVLIAGMEKISVNIGQFILTGEPVAMMGSSSRVASVLSASVNQPVLYVEFRKDGTPIDPGPWWAASVGEKVRG